MRKLIVAFGVSVLFLSWLVYSLRHTHGKVVSAAVSIDHELVPRIDREQIHAELEVVLDLAVKGELCGKTMSTHRKAFAQAMKKESVDSNRTHFLFVFKFKDCNYDIATWGTSDDCGVACLSVIICQKCGLITTASLYDMRM